jgi:predicted transposase YbfD/YdcC
VGKDHGREELRELWALPISPEEMRFCACAQIVRIHRHFKNRSTGEESDETVLGISSLLPLADPKDNAEWLLDIARGHWTIENGNHYVRDRTYDEDRCQVRNPNSAQILATLRSLARFLAKKGIHRPRCAHQRTTPALNRFCQYHRTLALRWLTT